VLIGFVAQARPLAAQTGSDPLSAAKDRYAEAAYEDTLGLLDQLKPADSNVALRIEIEKYRFLCLLAVGRKPDAERAVQRLISLKPSLGATELDAAPWVRTAFTEMRRNVLPDIVTQKYEEAKAAVLAKSYATAGPQLKLVLALIDDPDLASTEERWRKDLKTLTQGFMDLVQIATPAPPPEAPAPAAPSAPPSVSPVVPPVAVRQEIPPWPADLPGGRDSQEGIIQLVVDETGAVASAVIVRPINPVYDQILLQAARTTWQYKPATRDGAPVRYTKILRVVVNPR
jgi:hypothetical protein